MFAQSERIDHGHTTNPFPAPGRSNTHDCGLFCGESPKISSAPMSTRSGLYRNFSCSPRPCCLLPGFRRLRLQSLRRRRPHNLLRRTWTVLTLALGILHDSTHTQMSKRPEHPMSPTCGVEKRHRTRDPSDEERAKVKLPDGWSRIQEVPVDNKPAADPGWVPHRECVNAWLTTSTTALALPSSLTLPQNCVRLANRSQPDDVCLASHSDHQSVQEPRLPGLLARAEPAHDGRVRGDHAAHRRLRNPCHRPVLWLRACQGSRGLRQDPRRADRDPSCHQGRKRREDEGGERSQDPRVH